MAVPKSKHSFKVWKAENEDFKNGIIRYLADNFAKPKRFTDIWENMKRNDLCNSRNSLILYLEQLDKEGKVTKVSKGKRSLYALSNYKNHEYYGRIYEKTMKESISRNNKKISKLITAINNGLFSEDEIYSLVYCSLLDFEFITLDGLITVFNAEPIQAFVASSIVKDYFDIPYNWTLQLIWNCKKKYEKTTKKAIDDLMTAKRDKAKELHFKAILENFDIGIRT